jgi:hypothetical protein
VGLNFEPALEGWLGIALAAFLVAGSGMLLRLVALCRHHMERLALLDAEERKLEKRHRIREEKLAKAQAHAAAKAAQLTGRAP